MKVTIQFLTDVLWFLHCSLLSKLQILLNLLSVCILTNLFTNFQNEQVNTHVQGQERSGL